MERLGRLLRRVRAAQVRFRLSDALRFAGGWLKNEVLRRRPEYQLRTRWARFPVTVRRGTSDPLVFLQIFVFREYRALDDLQEVDLVIDGGANVGYSSVYFLSRFPSCTVIAVEPDSANFSVLQRNLAPYADRAIAVPAALWSHTGLLVPRESPYRDGREWARQVREPLEGEEGNVRAVNLPTLLERAGRTRISLLKMDIEGAEVEVFRDAQTPWLEQTDVIAVELHDDSTFGPATPLFLRAMAQHRFAVTTWGELTIARRAGSPPRSAATSWSR